MNAIWFYGVAYAALTANLAGLMYSSRFWFGVAWGLIIAWVTALVLEAL